MLVARSRPLILTIAPEGAAWMALAVLAGSALIALSAQVSIPLPFSPVPVTRQTFAVLLVAAPLGARLGPASVGLYGSAGLWTAIGSPTSDRSTLLLRSLALPFQLGPLSVGLEHAGPRPARYSVRGETPRRDQLANPCCRHTQHSRHRSLREGVPLRW